MSVLEQLVRLREHIHKCVENDAVGTPKNFHIVFELPGGCDNPLAILGADLEDFFFHA